MIRSPASEPVSYFGPPGTNLFLKGAKMGPPGLFEIIIVVGLLLIVLAAMVVPAVVIAILLSRRDRRQ